ncbi:hypothetical protein [Micromonospora sp. CP22]|uniref:hypothetical protein n=1 Tax=Micromonospora sp. CP22 TaxID=2580517 RepID=UPI0012BCDFF8|nr:hypothetical protein [Micromonospora sp. CP22]MTK05445.1 hypothetical protein [Micromonospora sp. CP22]
MSDTVEDGREAKSGGPANDRDEALKALVAQADLTDIRVTKWHAELLSDTPAEVGELDLKVASAFRLSDEGFDTRFSVDAPLVSRGGGERVASVQMVVVASFSLASQKKPEKELLSAFMDQVAFFVVMPFIREGLHSLSMRIGLEPITIGLLHQGKATPTTAWTSTRHFHGVSTRDEPAGR